MMQLENVSINELWERIQVKLDEHVEPYKDMDKVYEFHLTDELGSIYQLELTGGRAYVYRKHEKEADCTLKMKTPFFKKFLCGDVNSTTAFMTGKLKVDGNIGAALALEKLLKHYDFSA